MNLDLKELKAKLAPVMNRAILTPVVVTLVGLVLLIPTQLMSGRLKSAVQSESVSMGNRLRNLDAVPEEQWKMEQAYQEAFAADANRAELLSLQSTQRELLSYRLFPDPCSTSQMIFENYARAYRAGIEAFVAQAGGVWRPSDLELQHELEKAGPSLSGGRRVSTLLRSRTGTMDLNRMMLSETERTIVDLLCLEKAKSGRLYASAADLSGYDFWGSFKYEGAESAVRNCWYYQLAYWVIEDVFQTASAMNAGSTSVPDSTVKRVVGVWFKLDSQAARSRSGPYSRPLGAAGRGAGGKQDIPSYAKSQRDGALTDACTARYCDADWDVVHFNVAVVVRADATFAFMNELCSGKTHVFRGWDGSSPVQPMKHNQITILEASMYSVDRGAGDHALYRYGENAVVQLDLICEYLFYKPAYDMILPQLIKDDLAADTSSRRR